MSIESMMPSNHLILCHLLFFLSSIFPSIRVCSNELALHIMWPSTGVSASASDLPISIQGWCPWWWSIMHRVSKILIKRGAMCYTIFSPPQIETTKIVPPDFKKKACFGAEFRCSIWGIWFQRLSIFDWKYLVYLVEAVEPEEARKWENVEWKTESSIKSRRILRDWTNIPDRVIHDIKNIVSMKRDEIMPFVDTWMDLVTVILNNVSQKEKSKYCVLTHICVI